MDESVYRVRIQPTIYLDEINDKKGVTRIATTPLESKSIVFSEKEEALEYLNMLTLP